MSKTIYYVTFIRDPQQPAKFKFAIDNSSLKISEVKKEVALKLLAKGALQAGEQIVLKDQTNYELCSDDEVADVLPEPEKKLVATLKQAFIAVSSPAPAPTAVNTTTVAAVPTPTPTAPTTAPTVQKILLKQAGFIAKSKPNTYVEQKCQAGHVQIRFQCPQLFGDNQYGLIIPQLVSFYELSRRVCQMFDLTTKEPVIALFYEERGVPLLWSVDYMSLLIKPGVFDGSKLYTVVFTHTKSTSHVPVPVFTPANQTHQIFIVHKGTAHGLKLDLADTTVSQLKSMIFHKLQVHPLNQILKVGSVFLETDSQQLSFYNVTASNTVVELSVKTRSRVESLTYADNFFSPQIIHSSPQTVKALRVLRANLMVFCRHLPENIRLKLMVYLRGKTGGNNPMICAFEALCNRYLLAQTQKIALEELLLNEFAKILVQVKDVPVDCAAEDIFLYTRQCLGHLVNQAKKLADNPDYATGEKYSGCSASCAETLVMIEEPVRVKLLDQTTVITDRKKYESLRQANSKFADIPDASKVEPEQCAELASIYKIYNLNNSVNEHKNIELRVLQTSVTPSYPKTVAQDFSQVTLTDLGSALQNTESKLKVYNGLELKHKVDYVYLLKDKSDNQLVYVAKGKDVANPHTVFDPTTGDETCINFDVIAGAAGSESVEKPIEEKDIKPIITRAPAQAIIVLIDISGSMGGRYFNEADLNRMGAVKSFFEAFAYRTMAYNMEHVISLILFDNVADLKIDFTESFHDFNVLVANANPRGATNLYDAIVVACDRLAEFKKKYPECVMRILALTDGEDTGSRSNIVATADRVVRQKIILDSFVVGTNCEGLKCITFAAGGKCYLARTLDEGLKLFQQETVISYRVRKPEPQQECGSIGELVQKMKLRQFDLPNSVHGFKVPEMKPVLDTKQLTESISNNPTKMGSASGASLKRIMKEYQNYQNDPHPFVSIYPCGDMTLWKILLYGPSKTPYEGGIYLLYAQFPQEYPFKPPVVRFITPIYHCNMNSQGRICHSVFDRNYSPALNFKTIVESVYGLILTPEPDDPLDNVIASYYLSNYEQYEKNATHATKTQANKTPEQIVEELFGKIADDNQRQEKIQLIKDWIKKAQAAN